MSDREKKNERLAMFLSLGIHGVLLLIFFLILAWREPDPPIPEYGIELNFGLDRVGSGDIQPTEEPVTENVDQDEPEPVEEPVEEPSEPVEEVVEEVVEETTSEPASTITEDIHSPDVVEATESESEPEVQPTPVADETAEAPAEAEPVEEAPPTPTLDSRAQMPSRNSQGDDPGEVGDKGDPEGEIDEQALYGAKGSGGGASLSMAGWDWDNIPEPDDQSSESGTIVFEIKIDSDGEVTGTKVIQSTVTPAVLRIYQNAVRELTFHKTANSAAAPSSTGRITFILKAK